MKMGKKKVKNGLYTNGRHLVHVWNVWFLYSNEKWLVDYIDPITDQEGDTDQDLFLEMYPTRITKLKVEFE